jgi:hypothetical protein
MKPEDRRRLKRFWLIKGLILTGVIGVFGITFALIPLVELQLGIIQETEVPRALRTYRNSRLKNLQSRGPELVCSMASRSSSHNKYSAERKSLLDKSFLEEPLAGQFCSQIILNNELGTLVILIITVVFFLVSSLYTPSPYPLTWSGHLLLPEEMIAELIALKRRRQKQNLPQWKLLLELTVEVLLLLWAIHIQVRFQNLSLPPSKKRNID